MILPENFNYSQKSLQDFVYCRRLFKYRYIDRINWPAVELDPVNELELRAKSGADFHRAVHQYFAGVSEEKIEDYLVDSSLKKWWDNFKISIIKNLDEADKFLPEVRLYSVIQGFRVIAKLDLVAIKPDGRWIIYDWKTSKIRYKSGVLGEHFQSKVYPYILFCAGKHLCPSKRIEPDQLKMIYWFAEYPWNMEIFEFDKYKLTQAKDEIGNTIEKISGMNPEEFLKTDQEVKCKFCVYRALCERGDLPGQDGEANELIFSEESAQYEYDFDQIVEIEF